MASEIEVEWPEFQLLQLEAANSYEVLSYAEIGLPVGIKAYDFLLAAQRHLREANDEVHLVDAITNAKRALDCRLQELLFVFGLDRRTVRWPVPKKLDLMAQLGLAAPRILSKVNTFRNTAEHDFRPPSVDAAADFIDAITLFLDGTWLYIAHFVDTVRFTNTEWDDLYWLVHFDRDLSQFTIRCHSVEDGSEDSSGTLGLQDRQFLPYLRAYLALIFHRPCLPWAGDDRLKDFRL